MKSKLYLFILLVASTIFTSCHVVSHIPKPDLYTTLDQQTTYVETYSEIKAVGCSGVKETMTEEACNSILSKLPNIYGRYMGTGTFVYYKNKLSVLTAEHVCWPDGDVPETITRGGISIKVQHKIKIDIKSQGFSTKAKIVKKNAALDLCMLELENQPVRFFDPARVSPSEPIRGEKVYYAGGPMGMISDKALLTFKGMFAGEMWGMYMFGLPCAQGASGSSIRNSENLIISMVQRVHARFPHLCYGVDTESIRNFVND